MSPRAYYVDISNGGILVEEQKEYMVYCQEIDISSGNLPLPLLRSAVAECPEKGRTLQDVGLVRDGSRVLLKLYFRWSGVEDK